jgi:hypothetical protein
MSLDCVRKAHAEALASPCVEELITVSQLTIRVRTWTGRVGDGTFSDSDLVLPKRYELRELSSREVASSGGRYSLGDVRMNDLTKAYAGGGYTRAQLDPASAFSVNEQSKRVMYVLTGDVSGIYSLIDIKGDDIVSWSLVLRRTRDVA